MSASSGPLASTKGESTSSKATKPAYDHLDINKLYKGKSTEPVSKPVTQKHGMQALGKAIPARRPGQTSVKAETNDVSNNSSSQTSSAALAPNQGQQSQGNHHPPGWASSIPHPPGPPSPHNVPNVPLTGQHVHDKNWSGGPDMVGPYPSQRFAQEFPSLASGADAQKATATSVSGPSSSAQAQSMSKSQDNQYGPGPILRPQTEGSWTQGGGRSMPRPPGPAPPLNAPPREFQGPERPNLGGPTPPPITLGQGGPAPPPLGAYPMQFRGMMPPHPFMFPNGPAGPGFYPPGTRFAMPVPPRAPPPTANQDGPPRDHYRGRHQQPARPSSNFANKPIIKDEDLKRMDEIGTDGGWASTQDDVDYNKTINFSDEDDQKENKKSGLRSGGDGRGEGRHDRDRGTDDMRGMDQRRPPTKILERQSSVNDREGGRDGKDQQQQQQQQQQRYENASPKDIGPPQNRNVGQYNNENEEEWKSQQFPQQQQQQQQQRRMNMGYEEKPREHRDRRNDERGGPPGRRPGREEMDNWRSSNANRQYEEDMRGNKGPQQRGRDEPRIEPREFPSKNHPSNLPPRLQRQQFQAGPGAGSGGGGPQPPQQQPTSNQRQTPSPGSTGAKDRDFQGSRDWDREKGQQQDRRRLENDQNRNKRDNRDNRRYYNDYEPRNDRIPDKEHKNSRYGQDFQRERSKESDDAKSSSSVSSGSAPTRADASKSGGDHSPESKDSSGKHKQDEMNKYPSSKPKMSWADEMDDDEIPATREQDDGGRKGKADPSAKSTQSRPDYYNKPVEERQKRVIINKNQRKVADMQSQKQPEPPVEVKQQSSEPQKLESEPTEKVKPVSAWGERENREKMAKSERETSPPQKDTKYSGNMQEKDGRKSQEKESPPRSQHQPSSQGPYPPKGVGSSSVVNSMESVNSSGGSQEMGYKSAMITKSTSGRSLKDEVDGSGHRLGGGMDQRTSMSDTSDRDHYDRESISSQDGRSKPQSRQQGRPQHIIEENGKPKQQRPMEREKREKTLSERDGSDVGSEHGGSRGEKSQRGQRRDRGSYPVHPRGGGERQGWDRPRSRGARGRGGTHYYDKPTKRSDSEREHMEREDMPTEKIPESNKIDQVREEKKEKVEASPPASNKKEQLGDENQRPKKDKELENSVKKSGKNPSASKRSNNNARGGGKLEGYGPPSDQKPFSNSSKDEDSDKKEKHEVGQGIGKEGGIPSLMAVDISPPSMSQLKKGPREREFHTGRSVVPPRMQGQRGDQRTESYPERERYNSNSNRGTTNKRGKGGDAPSSGSLSQKKNEGEDSEEWTDNDSDDESKKSGSASNKVRKDSSSKHPGAEKSRHRAQSQTLSRAHGHAPGPIAKNIIPSMITLGPLPIMMSSGSATNTTTSTLPTIKPNISAQDSTNNYHNNNHVHNNIATSRSRNGNNKVGPGSARATAAAAAAGGGDTSNSFAKSIHASSFSCSSSSAAAATATPTITTTAATAELRNHMISDNNEHIDDHSGGLHEKKKTKISNKQQPEKGFIGGGGGASATTTSNSTVKPTRNGGENNKGGKTTRVKNVPYDARTAVHLPPRFANKRDSHSGPSAPAGNGKSPDNSIPTKGVEPAAPPPTNAWEKPIATAFRPEQNSSQPVSSSTTTTSTSHGSLETSKESSDLKLSSVSPITGASSGSTVVTAAVLDGTNPPAHTMIFENRKLKSGYSDQNKSGASKLPEVKKDNVSATSGIEFGKNLGSLGFGKGPGEDSPELDFGPSPFDEPAAVTQSQAPQSMMTHASSPKPAALLQQSSRHAFDHQSSPISPCAAELTEKIQSVKRVWETPTMPSVPEQPNNVHGGPDETAFHGAFGNESYKGSESSNRDYGPSSLPQSAVGYSGGSSPSMAAMANNDSRSSPNANNIRPPNKPPQQQPPVTKAQGHATMTSAFGSYGMEPQQHMSANNYGTIPVVAQPNKIMYGAKVVPMDPFTSQFTQYQNAPGTGCAPSPYGQQGSVLIRGPMEPKYQQQLQYQQHGGQNRQQTGQGTNHNRVSPGPITSSSGGNAASGPHINSRSNTMMQKNPQQNRNTAHTCITQQPVHQQNFYHTHTAMAQQQVPKGAFGPANGGYSDGGLGAAYPQPQILIPVDVNAAMFNIGGNYESSDLRSGPQPTGPPPPGTPPVQGSSSYYFGSNNNPACVFPPNSSQNYGHGLQFATSLKMPGFNSTGASASDSTPNMATQRIRPSDQPFIQQGLEALPQNAMKSQHEYLMNQQQRWNTANDFSVSQGLHWSAAPGPIQRPIYNAPSAGPVGMPMVHSSSHYMPQNIGAPPGHVGVKPNNSSNDSMANPGTPPKSPHPRKNI